MTLAYCQCGHAQVLHMGPYGHCCAVDVVAPHEIRCKCGAFVLAVPAVIAPELERSDLQ